MIHTGWPAGTEVRALGIPDAPAVAAPKRRGGRVHNPDDDKETAMIGTAETKWAEALAEEIADEIRPYGPVEAYYDREAQALGVRISDGRNRYELLIPAPGAVYALFRNGRWLGGMNLRSDAAPAEVAHRLIGRVIATR